LIYHFGFRSGEKEREKEKRTWGQNCGEKKQLDRTVSFARRKNERGPRSRSDGSLDMEERKRKVQEHDKGGGKKKRQRRRRKNLVAGGGKSAPGATGRVFKSKQLGSGDE